MGLWALLAGFSLLVGCQGVSVVMLQEEMSITPSGKCHSFGDYKSDFTTCADGSADKGKVRASAHGISSLDGCKAAIAVGCYPKVGLYASYNAFGDKCGWSYECDMTDLKKKDSDWRTEKAELKADQTALMIDTPEQPGAQLNMMLCGTSCVCTSRDQCSGECEYKCTSDTIRSKGKGMAAIVSSKDIQNPLKVCYKLARGSGSWSWHKVQLVKGLNRFEISAAPGQNAVTSSFKGADSCRTLSEPCFINDGKACPAPTVPAGNEPGLKASYYQMDVSCSLPTPDVFNKRAAGIRALVDTPGALDKIPFVRLAPAKDAVSFGAQWEGAIEIKAGGSYTFYLEANGVVGLWVKGKRLIANSGCLSAAEKSGSIDLEANSFPSVVVQYAHKGDGPAIKLSYKGPDATAKVEIPKQKLWHRSSGSGSEASHVAITVVGFGDAPMVQVCGTRAKDGGCEFDASCQKTCTAAEPLVPGKGYIPHKSAMTVSLSRGTPTDFVQKVTEVCFWFAPSKPSAGFSWEAVSVEGQLSQDGDTFSIKPSVHGEPKKVAQVRNGHKQCMSGVFEDTSSYPYAVANNAVPDLE